MSIFKENTFESMKVENPLLEIFRNSQTWDELIQRLLDNYVCPESKVAVAQIYNREYIIKELGKIKGELSQECKVMINGEQRIVSNVVMAGDKDENGNPKHAMIFLRDVTDSKNAEKERRKMLRQNIAMVSFSRWLPELWTALLSVIWTVDGMTIMK